MSRLPTTWPRMSPSPAKRCWTTSAQVRPHSSSPHSAASAIRRSPGGSTPNSPRSRPDEPPLSATVTIGGQRVDGEVGLEPAQGAEGGEQAVPAAQGDGGLGGVACHQLTPGPGRGGARRCRSRASRSRRGDLLGHRHAAVLAAGAADGDGHEALALAQVALGRGLQHRDVLLEELGRAGPLLDVRRHRLVAAVERAQLGHPERVGQEAHVGDEVGVDRDAVLEAEAGHRDLEPRRLGGAEGLGDPVGELVDVEVGGVDDHVGVARAARRARRARAAGRAGAGRCPAAGADAGRPPGGVRGRRRWPRGRAASWGAR